MVEFRIVIKRDLEYLPLLKQGAEKWNEWRENNPRSTMIDFTGVDLCGCDLRKTNLTWIIFDRANLSRTDLRNANLNGATFCQTNLSCSNLSEVNLKNCDLNGATLFQANLSKADLTGANLTLADLSEANLHSAKLESVDAKYLNLSRADLTKASFVGAVLWNFKSKGANFTNTDLVCADIRESDLSETNLSGLYLNGAILTSTNLSRANLENTVLRNVYFGHANLSESNLKKAILDSAMLYDANLCKADLSGAYLIATQALNANFDGAILTGACLEDWNTHRETNLDNVVCDYIYLKASYLSEEKLYLLQERRPHNGNFAPGEFTKVFQKTLETVDLIFSNGIDWQAFLNSFQKLQIECGSGELDIQAIEKKSGGAFVVRVEVPIDTNKAEVEKYLKREYEIQLKAIEDKYRLELNAKDKEIEIYKEKSADILELAKLAASRPINISQTQGHNMAGDRKINADNYYEQNGNLGIGHNEGKIGDNAKITGLINEAQQQNLSEAAAEIQALLKQLEQSYPTKTTSAQMIIAAKAMEHIESNPTLKQRAISAVKEGSFAAFEKAIDNPAGAFIVNAIKGWQEVK